MGIATELLMAISEIGIALFVAMSLPAAESPN